MRQQPCSDTGIDDSPHNHDRVDDNNDNACHYDNDRVDIDDNHEYRPALCLHLRSEHAVRRAKRGSGVVHVRRIGNWRPDTLYVQLDIYESRE